MPPDARGRLILHNAEGDQRPRPRRDVHPAPAHWQRAAVRRRRGRRMRWRRRPRRRCSNCVSGSSCGWSIRSARVHRLLIYVYGSAEHGRTAGSGFQLYLLCVFFCAYFAERVKPHSDILGIRHNRKGNPRYPAGTSVRTPASFLPSFPRGAHRPC